MVFGLFLIQSVLSATVLYTIKKVEWSDWKDMVRDLVKTMIEDFYTKADKTADKRDQYPRRRNVRHGASFKDDDHSKNVFEQFFRFVLYVKGLLRFFQP